MQLLKITVNKSADFKNIFKNQRLITIPWAGIWLLPIKKHNSVNKANTKHFLLQSAY